MNDSSQEPRRAGPPGAEGRPERRHEGDSLVPPIFQTATFAFQSAAELAAFHGGDRDPARFYSRYGNPTVAAAEARLARLEGADSSLLYASGMAAVSSVFLALLAPEARLILLGESYRHTRDVSEGLLSRYGVRVEQTSGNTLEALGEVEEGAVRVLFLLR